MKKFFALLLSLIILLGVFSGCTSSDENENAMTREVWIGMLADAYSLDTCYNNTPVYSDVPESSAYFEQIQSCVEWNILDADTRFYPSLSATNAFAVVTAVRAIGLDKIEKTTNAPSLESIEEIEDYFVQQTDIELEMPSALTQDTAQQILDASLDLAAGLVLKQYHNFEYQDDVLVIRENDITVDYENQTASVRGTRVSNGAVVVVQPSSTLPQGLMVKVTESDGNRFSFEDAQLEDVYTAFSFYGTYTPEVLSVTPLTDGVTVQNNSSDTAVQAENAAAVYEPPAVQPLGLSAGTPSAQPMVDAKVTMKDLVYEIDKTIESNGASVNVNGSIGIKDILVTAVLEYDLLKLKEASVQVDSTIVANLEVSSKIDKTFKIAKVRCRLYEMIGVDFIVSLHIGLDGKISVDFSVDDCEGISYQPEKKAKIYANFQKPDLQAEVQVQAAADPSITAELVVCSLAVTNIGAEVGLRADAKVLSTADGLTCTDVNMYVLVSAFVGHDAQNGKETLLAKLGVQKDWDIWTKDNTKMKKSWHIENGQVVPQCTRGTGIAPPTTEEETTLPAVAEETGKLSGKICKASNRASPIGQANISVFNSDGMCQSASSDDSGNYSLTLPVDDYRIEITAPGYINFTAYASVTEDEDTYMETFLMVSGSEGATGTATGTINNALTGSGVSNVSLSVRSGWNNSEHGSVITSTVTDAQGNYSLTLPFGNYTIVASKTGFISASVNIIVQAGTTDSQNGTITPIISGDNFRIVLTWGERPNDLDSHVEGKLSDGSSFHVCYYHKSQNDGDVEICNLDVDDQTSYGPETITLNATNDTPYYYYVHRYSGSGTIASSEAKIKVYQGSNLVADFNAPTNLGNDDYWNVFAIVDGEVVVQNSITSSPDTRYATRQ